MPGVSFVDLSDATRGQRFQRFGNPAAGEAARGFIPNGRLEIARADSSPNFPENGHVDFILEGLYAQRKISRSLEGQFQASEQVKRAPRTVDQIPERDLPTSGGGNKKKYYN